MNYTETPEGRKILDRFLSKYAGKSSQRIYKSDIEAFFTWHGGGLADLEPATFGRYRDELAGQVAPGSIKRKMSVLNGFLKFAEKRVHGFKSPIGQAHGDLQRFQSVEYLKTDAYRRHIAKWAERLKEERKSAQTLQTYRFAVDGFLKWSGKAPGELTHKDFVAYRDHMTAAGLAPATQWLKLVGINSFLKTIRAAKVLPDIKALKLPKVPKAAGFGNVLDIDEVQSLLANPDRGSLMGKRDYFVLRLMLDWGPRVGEVVALRRRDLAERVQTDDGGSLAMWIRGRKGAGADTRIFLSGELLAALDDWMDSSGIEFAPDAPLLCAFRWIKGRGRVIDRRRVGKPITTRALEGIVWRHITGAGIEAKGRALTPHALRHTCFTQMAARGVPLPQIKYAAGHQSVQTTEIYTHHRQSHKDNLGRLDLYGPADRPF